ncbi:MAG: BlaI/MecI/CopY family transcriptional regulator [Acidobacteriota bacterium]
MSSPKFRLRGSRPLSEAVLDSLGELERETLKKVRLRGECTVSQACADLTVDYAYTTVMTTLDRLFKKGVLARRKEGRAFIYSAKYSVEEMERTVAEDVISRLLDSSTGRVEPVLACIVDSVSDRDRLLLDELERLVQAKRRIMDAEAH